MNKEKIPELLRICQNCKIGYTLYMIHFMLRNAKLKKEYKTCLELTPCDFVALLLDPKEGEQVKSSSYLDLIRNCFHQSLTLFRNGVSDHVYETVLGNNLISQKDIDYVV